MPRWRRNRKRRSEDDSLLETRSDCGLILPNVSMTMEAETWAITGSSEAISPMWMAGLNRFGIGIS